MGLSATQMRFLMVTARKSNVEFQGQQVNQARTDLANQSSALYTELLQLKAPTAPSKYTYIISPTKDPAIDWDTDNSYPLSGDAAVNFTVYYSANHPNFMDFNITQYVETSDGFYQKVTGKDEKGNNLYAEEKIPAGDMEDQDGTYFYKTKGQDGAGNEVPYTAIHVGADENFTYDPKTGLFQPKTEDGVKNADMPKWIQAYNHAMSYYNTYSEPNRKAVYPYYNGDGTKFDTDTLESLSSKEDYAVSYTTSATVAYNDAQYKAALEQYEQDLAEYEKAYAEINKKTEEIHEADKKLELQLKQLDTEQEAIQTEYDALKKVLDKNIENTFKTFG